MASRPTDTTFAAIVSAIAAIEADPHAPRTKAHLMRLAGIAHPTVHRAFKWDAAHGSPFRITERWNEITEAGTTRRSPERTASADLEAKLRQARHETQQLRDQLDAARLVAAAAWLRASEFASEQPTVIRPHRRSQ